MKIIAFLILSFFTLNGNAQDLSGKKLIELSCTYHDPNHILKKNGVHMELEEPRTNQETRYTSLDINPAKGIYSIVQKKGSNTISYIFKKGEWEISLNGNPSYTKEEEESYNLTKERAELLKNYYYYLWSLPCNLLKPEAQIKDDVYTRNFNDKKLLEVTVEYPSYSDPDTWRFYFNPETYALEGYLFFSNDSEGEYIFLEGEESYRSLKIPSTRSWYDNHDDQFLATDRLIRISKFKKP